MSQDTQRCIIVDDHPLMREIIAVRARAAGMLVIAEAGDATSALRVIERERPDVAIVDLRMPEGGGIAIVREVAQRGWATRTLLYSDDANPTIVRRALDAGAHGYLNKASGQELLAAALDAVTAGHRFVDPSVAATLLNAPTYDLSPRELQVLALMSTGMQNKVIAIELSVSEETVKTHVSSLMAKLGATSRTGAVAIALREDLVS